MRGVQQGILLKRINYSETSLILQFFTREEGSQSFIFQGGKKKNGNLLQALSMVEICYYKRKSNDLGKITSVGSTFVPQELPYHPIKRGILFFMAEILSQVLQKGDKDVKLYSFLETEIIWLDCASEFTNYPLWFLIKLSEKLGMGIHVIYDKGAIFDIQEGTISNQTPTNNFFVSDATIPILIQLLDRERDDFLTFAIHKNNRNQIIAHLLDYFKLHITGFKTSKSWGVLQEIYG